MHLFKQVNELFAVYVVSQGVLTVKFKKLFSAALISGTLAMSGVANGAIFDISYKSFANGSVTGDITLGETTKSVPAGMLKLGTEFVSGEPVTDIYSQILAFCLEVDVLLTNGQYELLGAADYFDGTDKLMTVEALFSKYLGQTGSAVNDAAFQLALWEIIYDNDGDLSGGLFSAAENWGEALTKAQEWLGDLGAGAFEALWVFEAPGMGVERDSQDLITWKVPEPASLALIGAGLIGFGALRRRKAA